MAYGWPRKLLGPYCHCEGLKVRSSECHLKERDQEAADRRQRDSPLFSFSHFPPKKIHRVAAPRPCEHFPATENIGVMP